MALVSLRQVLDHAAEHGYGVPAFNVNNLEQVQAIMEAAQATDSPVILQASAGARKYAGEAYLRHLYTPEGQEIAAKHHLRPRDPQVLTKYAKQFPKVTTFTVDEVFGGWSKAQAEHFNDGGHYDQVILAAKGR